MWTQAAKNLTLSGLVDEVIKTSSAYPRLGRTGGAQAVFNIDKLSGLAREFEVRGAKARAGAAGAACMISSSGCGSTAEARTCPRQAYGPVTPNT